MEQEQWAGWAWWASGEATRNTKTETLATPNDSSMLKQKCFGGGQSLERKSPLHKVVKYLERKDTGHLELFHFHLGQRKGIFCTGSMQLLTHSKSQVESVRAMACPYRLTRQCTVSRSMQEKLKKQKQGRFWYNLFLLNTLTCNIDGIFPPYES